MFSSIYNGVLNITILKNVYKKLFPVIVRDKIYREISNPYSQLEDENKIIFVHIPKTAGNAITKSLYNKPAAGHDKLIKYKESNEEKYRSYFKFCIVRNPWDRMVSAYHYLKEGGKGGNDADFANTYLSSINDFKEFVYKLQNKKFKNKVLNWIHFVPQYAFVCDEKDNIEVDFYGKYEQLEQDFNLLKKSVGMTEANMIMDNKSSHNAYWDYYNMEMVEIVRDIYKKDIDIFDYEFPYEKLKSGGKND